MSGMEILIMKKIAILLMFLPSFFFIRIESSPLILDTIDAYDTQGLLEALNRESYSITDLEVYIFAAQKKNDSLKLQLKRWRIVFYLALLGVPVDTIISLIAGGVIGAAAGGITGVQQSYDFANKGDGSEAGAFAILGMAGGLGMVAGGGIGAGAGAGAGFAGGLAVLSFVRGKITKLEKSIEKAQTNLQILKNELNKLVQ